MLAETNKKYSYCGLGANESLCWFGIPRTATQTIKNYLSNILEDNKHINLPNCAFSVIRNPSDRFKSAICAIDTHHDLNIDLINFSDEHFLPQINFDFHKTDKQITYLYYNQNIVEDIERFLLTKGVVITEKNTFNQNKMRLNATTSTPKLDKQLRDVGLRVRLRDIYEQDYKFIEKTNFWNMQR